MKAYALISIVAVTVVLTSVIWYLLLNSPNPQLQSNTSTPSSTPKIEPTVIPTQVPSATPTPTLKPEHPSIPEFTVQFVNQSYEVPAVYRIDPYTGENKLISAAHHVENRTLELTIKNQPFTPYKTADDKDVELYYLVRYKGHFQEWTDGSYTETIQASDSAYTSLTFIIGGYRWENIPHNGTVDIQIKAQIGYYSLVYDPYYRPWDYRAVLNVAGESDWSDTRIVIIP